MSWQAGLILTIILAIGVTWLVGEIIYLFSKDDHE